MDTSPMKPSPMKPVPDSIRTNISWDDMIPETDDPKHDSRYWCLPPVQEDLSVQRTGSGKAMHLVTQGHQCRIYCNVSVAKAMAAGHPAGVFHGHESSNSACPVSILKTYLRQVKREAQPASPSLSSASLMSYSTTSSARPTGPAPPANFFALWKGGKIYANEAKAKAAFINAAREGDERTLLATADYDAAYAYLLGIGAAEF
ncbi:hypothetical protein DFH07DRAFT_949907 [Mycena maculata]|uniref:Uncharacterized protein n=1 Tax=Mycena maculata TaxID=230809 RepID=A0AAD7K8L3_9AGAR|nr:hypothetical protein DFH07DRAFT_949907 [Mycena maculata]